MKITFLGTSASQPSLNRNTTSIALEFKTGEFIMVDCGEATLLQLMRSPLKFSRVHTIFITHLHGDHIYGLPGFLSTLNSQRTEPLTLYGPRGIKKFCSFFEQSIRGFHLTITEIDGECLDVCNLQISDQHVEVKACHVSHSTECYSYKFTQTKIKNKINIKKVEPIIEKYQSELISLGYKPPKKIIQSIVNDSEFTLEFKCSSTGNNISLNAWDYVFKTPPSSLVIALDNYKCPNIFSFFKECDVLIHESTYVSKQSSSEEERNATHTKALTNHHSTNLMAAKNGIDIGAKKLILTHFSNRYKFEDGKMVDEDEIIEACREVGFNGETAIAYDFSEFEL